MEFEAPPAPPCVLRREVHDGRCVCRSPRVGPAADGRVPLAWCRKCHYRESPEAVAGHPAGAELEARPAPKGDPARPGGVAPSVPSAAEEALIPCRLRGDRLREVPCELCGANGRRVAVFACQAFGECTAQRHRRRQELPLCTLCESRAP